VEDMLSLIPEVSSSFSWFSEWGLQCKLPAYILNILPRVVKTTKYYPGF